MKTYNRLSTVCARCSALLGILAATLSASPASAGEEVPFRARFQAIAEQTPTFPITIVRVTAVGQATHLGSTLAVTDNERVDFTTGLGTATYDIDGYAIPTNSTGWLAARYTKPKRG